MVTDETISRVSPWTWRLTLACLPALAGCDESPPSEAASAELPPLEITERDIRGADDFLLMRIDDVPGRIRADTGTGFGAAERFTDAALSPDGEWLAITTAGAAHGAGWLLPLDMSEPYPAAFQYGGSVSLGPWRDDGRYVVFALEGPAPNRTLAVVDREALGDTVSDNIRPVRLAEHAAQVPPETEYHAVEWHDGALIVEVDGERYRHDPASGETTAVD